MKIVMITGSPHRHGTSALLADAFIQGAQEAGHTVFRFDAAFQELHPCRACERCHNTDKGCIYKDGMEELNPHLLEADLVAFASPIYYYDWSAQLKLAIDQLTQQEAKEAATEILEFMGLAERASHKPNELSGGEKQRVAVARALINHPAVVLADEPSGSLDTHNKEELHQLFFDLRNRFGQTFVIVTHDEGLAQLTDRTIHLIDGEINKMV